MIRQATAQDIPELVALATALWPDSDAKQLETEFSQQLHIPTFNFFLAEDGDMVSAFIHVSIRHDYVEGSTSSPVGYIEGIFVRPDTRVKGVGKALVQQAEAWCRAHGCTEIGSDTEIDNLNSQAFHHHCGFVESSRIVAYIKKLS